MPIPVRSLDEMIRDVIASLHAGTRGWRPIYTLLLGSGFSYPVVPTPTQMLKSDIAWWRFCKDRRVDGPFRDRSEAEAMGLAADEISEFEKELWKNVHGAYAADEQKRFPLGADGLPDLTDPENVGRAYGAVMSRGLLNDSMRRQYLRNVVARVGRKVNNAHIFLAGILDAQETWDWGAPFCRTIFTTNFDPLLQRSLQLVNKLYYMIDRAEVLDAPYDDKSDAINLIYTHGSVHRYDPLSTGDQIEKGRRQNAARLVGYLQRHGVIVMGYSGWSDMTMQALLSCSSFDSGLYWCDIHPADQAEARLRPEVLELLRESGKDACYVHIPNADEAMRQLHSALQLGDVPKFILGPVPMLMNQLKSIEVPTEATGPAYGGIDMAELLARTVGGLEVAREAFDDPSIVRTPLSQIENEAARETGSPRIKPAPLAKTSVAIEEASITEMADTVFLSYVRENADVAQRLAADLEAAGVSVWLDLRRLLPGERWRDEIRKAIRNGHLFIACFSQDFANRDRSHMNEELTLAIEELRHRPTDRAWFIPVVIDGSKVPDRDIGAGASLRDLQWVDLSANWAEGVENLVRVALRHRPPGTAGDADTAIASDHPDSSTLDLRLSYTLQRGLTRWHHVSHDEIRILLTVTSHARSTAMSAYIRVQVSEEFTISPLGVSSRESTAPFHAISETVRPPATVFIARADWPIYPQIPIQFAEVVTIVKGNLPVPACAIQYRYAASNLRSGDGVVRISATEIAEILQRSIDPKE